MGCNSSKNVKLAQPQILQPRKLARRSLKHKEVTLQHHNRVSPLRHVPSTQRATEENDCPLLLHSSRTNKRHQQSSSKSQKITNSNQVSNNVCLYQNENNVQKMLEAGDYSQLANNTQHSHKQASVNSNMQKKLNYYQQNSGCDMYSSSVRDDVISRKSTSDYKKGISNNKISSHINNHKITIDSAVGLQENSGDGGGGGGGDDATSSQSSQQSVLSLSSLQLSGSFRSPVLMLDNGDCRLQSAGVMQPSELMIANNKVSKLRVKTSNRTHSPHSNDTELLLVCVDCGREINDQDDNCICPLTGKLH